MLNWRATTCGAVPNRNLRPVQRLQALELFRIAVSAFAHLLLQELHIEQQRAEWRLELMRGDRKKIVPYSNGLLRVLVKPSVVDGE